MKKDTVVSIDQLETTRDALTEVLREGAQKLIAEAVQAELEELLDQYEGHPDEQGRQRLVRNGYLPQREVQTGIGGIPVRIPRVRDRGSGQESEEMIRFRSRLVPPYLRRSKSLEELLPLLYLKGISTGDFTDALGALLGPDAPGLSANTISRLKQQWVQDYQQWHKRDLSQKRYVYVWADGVYCNCRFEDARVCLLVLIGARADGKKELIAVEDGYRESEQSWWELLRDLHSRGLTMEPKLATGDGALGFWKALDGQGVREHPPATLLGAQDGQRAELPAEGLAAQGHGLQQALQQIWMAETREDAYRAFDEFIATYQLKFPKATACLAKDREALLAFYDFPAEHWPHLRTTNPIESTFATVKLRTAKTRGCLSRQTMLTMVFKLCRSAERRWRRLQGYRRLGQVIENVKFINGVREDEVAA